VQAGGSGFARKSQETKCEVAKTRRAEGKVEAQSEVPCSGLLVFASSRFKS
jgi:hypothetical protein